MITQKITTIDDLSSIRDGVQDKNKKLETGGKEKILVCIGGGCIASGALKVKTELEETLKNQGQEENVAVVATGCLGPCSYGPVIVMGKDKTFYQSVFPEDVKEIVEKHVMRNEVVERLTWKAGPDETPVPVQTDLEFFKRQTKIVLRNCGTIDPYSIEDYIGCDGYQALAKVLTSMSPDEVIEEVKTSGLRGRGGAGFPTGLKWSFARKSQDEIKYILCNADEGDPGAYMDRSVLEGDPHSVIEGMAIGAYAIGAKQGYIYVRAEYPLAVERLGKAIERAREVGILGKNILGTDFSFDLEIRMGSGAFVCGEETALIHSIEGKRGEPRPRPPFPAVKGLWDKPSLLNNVETYANIAAIILKGGDWFASFGTPKSKGTKVFALAGTVNNTGLVEVPVGTHLGDLVYDIGGGIIKGKDFKAAQIGGPSGGCIPKHHLNVPLDYESLTELGAIMGSGGLIVMDEGTCMVDIARFFLEFVQEESCGKCVPCRLGTRRMLDILENICAGKGKLSDIDELEQLGKQINKTALCALGQTGPNPVLSTLRHFRHEYIDHIVAKHCAAGVCPELVRAPCQSWCPAHVDVPGYVSLTSEKRYNEALRLHRNRNPFASVCASVCVHFCERQCRRATLDESVSIRGVKRFMVEQETVMQVPEVRENAENAKRKIAIIGAGPAGLSCAYFLARLGYKPHVFEAASRPGGMLVQTIPSYRLPREEVDKEIQMILDLGVTLETGKKLGRDFTLAGLKDDGYEAVFLGVGSPNGVVVQVQGFETGGVTDAITFLREYNMKGSVDVGRKVVVVGGGNSAIDAARTAIRLGAEVTIVYRRTRNEMPADKEEIKAALDEGVILKTLVNPAEIVASNGNMNGVKCLSMTLGEFDKSGRRAPKPTEEAFILEADQLIFAVGQRLDCDQLLGDVQVDTLWGTQIKVDEFSGQTSIPWIFAGGDAATGPTSVIEAVAGGERAAVGINEYLTGENHAFWREDKRLDTAFDPDADPIPDARIGIPHLPVATRKNSFDEVELVWSETDAMTQCKRCLRCDYGK